MFCLVSRPFLQNHSVPRMRTPHSYIPWTCVCFRARICICICRRSTLALSSWLMAFICHSDRATLISTAAAPSADPTSSCPRPLGSRHPCAVFSHSFNSWGVTVAPKEGCTYTHLSMDSKALCSSLFAGHWPECLHSHPRSYSREIQQTLPLSIWCSNQCEVWSFWVAIKLVTSRELRRKLTFVLGI